MLDTRFREVRLGAGEGLLVHGGGASPASLERRWLSRRLAQAGALLLRGFDADPDGFASLVRRISARVTLDRSRHDDPLIDELDAGPAPVGLHCEDADRPCTPQLRWFHCRRAVRGASPTLVCDGHRLWEGLSPGTQKLFLDHDVVYARRLPPIRWDRFADHLAVRSRSPERFVRETFDDDRIDDARTYLNTHIDGSSHYLHGASAVHPTLFGRRPAFANGILGPCRDDDAVTVTLDDRRPIPTRVICEIERVAFACTEPIRWLCGDILLLDNTRVMHGRRRATTRHQSLFGASSDLDPSGR